MIVQLSFQIRDGRIFIDGKGTLLFSGEVEYFRLEPEYWLPVLQHLKNSGMEWVSTYVTWQRHDGGVHAYDFDVDTKRARLFTLKETDNENHGS